MMQPVQRALPPLPACITRFQATHGLAVYNDSARSSVPGMVKRYFIHATIINNMLFCVKMASQVPDGCLSATRAPRYSLTFPRI